MYMSDIQGSKSRARRQHQTNMVLLSCSSTKLRPNSELVYINNDFEEYKMESPNFIMMELVDAHCSYEDVFRVIES